MQFGMSILVKPVLRAAANARQVKLAQAVRILIVCLWARVTVVTIQLQSTSLPRGDP
jgi:hypothetical protein